MPSLYSGNIGLIMIIALAWLPNIFFFIGDEYVIIPSFFWDAYVVGYVALFVCIVSSYTYMVPFAITFFIVERVVLGSHVGQQLGMCNGWFQETDNTYLGSKIIYQLLNGEPCYSVLNPSVPQDASQVCNPWVAGSSQFCDYWEPIVNYYVYYFEFLQWALLVPVLIALIWWLYSRHKLGRLGKLGEDIKYFWTKKTPGKNLRIILVFIFTFTISIPYWILFM